MEQEYLRLLERILLHGDSRSDRTGVGTLSLFGEQISCDLSKGFPLLTTKKMNWNSIVGELLWFLKGSQSNKELAEITHGDPNKKTIWTENAESSYWKWHAQFDGDVGRIYGVQWRKWRKYQVQNFDGTLIDFDCNNDHVHECVDVRIDHIDQVATLIDGLKNNPYSRRHILTAWNVAELDEMSLPSCHVLSQYYVSSDNKLSCHMYQRSGDSVLGIPFNIASYALLTHLLASLCDLDVGKLILSFGDVHIYSNHIPQAEEQLTRDPTKYSAPRLKINPDLKSIDDLRKSDIELIDYESYPAIKAKMAV